MRIGLEADGAIEIGTAHHTVFDKNIACTAGNLAAHDHAAMAFAHAAIADDDIFGGRCETTAVGIAGRFDGDAIVTGVKEGVLDQNVPARFRITTIIIGAVAAYRETAHRDVGAEDRTNPPPDYCVGDCRPSVRGLCFLMRSHFLLRLACLALGPTLPLLSAASSPPHATITQLAEAERQAFLATLEQLVSIESGSYDLEGLDRVADVIAARLASLGGKVENIEQGEEIYRMEDTPEKTGRSVLATFDGTGTKKILLIAHLDTVYPRGTLARQPYRVDGNRAYGLGISDDKQGITVILHTLELLRRLNIRHYGRITVLINADEEISSPSSRFLLTRLGAEHDVVLSYEGSRVDSDKISLATSGIAAATLIARGRGSHAGAAPERGVNALYELAHQILQARDLSEPEVGLKVNWTMAQAGIVRNMIPPEASARADIRVLRVADYDRIERALRERITTKLLPESTVELRFERRRPPLEATVASRALGEHATRIFKEIGRDLFVDDRPEGGGTDAAFAALEAKGPVIERMGLQGFGAHTTDNEYVLVDSIAPRLYLNVRLISDIASGATDGG